MTTFSKMEDAPMRFKIEEGVVDCKTIKVSCSDADGNLCKEELPIFTNNSPKETLILLLKESLVMAERFEWFNNDDNFSRVMTQVRSPWSCPAMRVACIVT